jgi:hypothetical protein
MAEPEQPKIIIDTDWKSQAQAEKERLSKATKPQTPAPGPSAAAAPGAPGEASDAPGEGPKIPEKVGFRELVSLLISQAIAYLGGYPDPRTGQAMVALDLAKLHIDLLGVLEEKTKGNLTENESKLLQRALQELRMEFVEVARAVERAVTEGRAKTVGGGADPGAPPAPKLNIPPLRTPQG